MYNRRVFLNTYKYSIFSWKEEEEEEEATKPLSESEWECLLSLHCVALSVTNRRKKDKEIYQVMKIS